jgi:hypothetical protein
MSCDDPGMRTATRPARAPKIIVDHTKVGSDAAYRAVVRKRLAPAFARANATQSIALVPEIVAQHEPSGATIGGQKVPMNRSRVRFPRIAGYRPTVIGQQ